jgi:hypothetical protein
MATGSRPTWVKKHKLRDYTCGGIVPNPIFYHPLQANSSTRMCQVTLQWLEQYDTSCKSGQVLKCSLNLPIIAGDELWLSSNTGSACTRELSGPVTGPTVGVVVAPDVGLTAITCPTIAVAIPAGCRVDSGGQICRLCGTQCRHLLWPALAPCWSTCLPLKTSTQNSWPVAHYFFS